MNILFANIIYYIKHRRNLSLLFNHRNWWVIRIFTGLSRKHFHLNSRSYVVLAAIHDPGNRGNDENNAKGSDTVVWFSVSREMGRLRTNSEYILMLLPVAGRAGGKRNKTVVKVT